MLSQSEEKRQKAVAAKDSRDHEQAHKLLHRYFPNMPEDARLEILEHGFQKGSGRVGRSQKLEDGSKVQLAVNAHIRHRLTQYDSILAANKGQDVKFAAREMVHGQVQAIADSWRATGSQPRFKQSWTFVAKDSVATLEANRQRRTQQNTAQITSADEAQVLEEALGGLHLNETQQEAETRAKAAQRRAQKVAQKGARRARQRPISEFTRNLLRQYELDPSTQLSKNQKRKVHRLQMEQKQMHGKHKEPQEVHERQDPGPVQPTKRGRNRKLRITANGVELEPRELDGNVPEYQPSDDRRSEDQPSDDESPKPRLLRSNFRKRGETTTNSGELRDAPGDGGRREARRQDRYGLDPSNYTPHSSPYSLRSRHRAIGNPRISNDEGLCSIQEATGEGRLLVEDSEWMDIDDISLRTERVHLA